MQSLPVRYGPGGPRAGTERARRRQRFDLLLRSSRASCPAGPRCPRRGSAAARSRAPRGRRTLIALPTVRILLTRHHERPDHPPNINVLVGEHLRHTVHRCGRDAAVLKRLQPVVRGRDSKMDSSSGSRTSRCRLSGFGVGELWLVGDLVHAEDRAELHQKCSSRGATTMCLPSLQRNACHGVMNGCAEPCGFWSSPVLR